jgi:RNA polymerase sigma factor (sigma-70 family)
MLPYSPARIVRGVNQNDPEINRWIYNFYLPVVERNIRTQIGNSQDLGDLVSIVFVKFWSHRKPFIGYQDIRDYIERTTYHVWSDYLKKQQENKTDSFTMADFNLSQLTDDQVPEAESFLLELVYRKIEELPTKTREVFLLYCKEHLSNEEIAKKLGMSVKTVKNHKSNALQFLKMEFQNKRQELPLPLILLLINLLYDKF